MESGCGSGIDVSRMSSGQDRTSPAATPIIPTSGVETRNPFENASTGKYSLEAKKLSWKQFSMHKRYFSIFFLFDFGLSQLRSLQFILYHIAGFYKPTVPQSPPSHLQDYSICNNARLEFSTNFVPSFDPNEWCLKNGLHSGGFEPKTSWSWVFCLDHKTTATGTKNIYSCLMKFKVFVVMITLFEWLRKIY